MSGVNKVILIGSLGKDPEVKSVSGGNTVANFSLATSEVWKDKQGQKQERTEWHRIVAWGKLAELCGQHLTKGRQVYIEGKLQTREWEKDGQKHYTTEIQATQMTFIGSKTTEEPLKRPLGTLAPIGQPPAQAGRGRDSYDDVLF